MAGALLAGAQERFDNSVRADFFAGFRGNPEAFERAMKKTEAVLADNPKHAEAMVWHGGGVFVQAGQAARNKDYVQASELWKRGMDEMAAAVALAPEDAAVLIPRGAILLAASQAISGDRGKELVKIGLGDYEKTYHIQRAYFDQLSGHARGELLFGLGEGYQRLGEDARAREWFEKLAAVNDPANGHLQQAKDYLNSGQVTGTRTCVGCHVAK